MSQLKKLAGDTAVYGLSSIIGRMLNYLLVPLYTSVFATGTYGVITELYGYVAFFNIVYTYGLETAFFRFATRHGFSEDKVYYNAQSLIILSSLLFSGILYFLSPQIASLLDYPDKAHLIRWLGLILGIDAIVAIPYAKLRLEKKAWTFAFTKIFNISLNIFLNIFFIIICANIYRGEFLPELKSWISWFYNPDWGVDYVILSNLIANATLIPIFWRLNRSFTFSLDKQLLRAMLVYAYPLLFMGLAGVTNEMLSRVLLKYWLPEGFYPGKTSLQALGIFGACYKLAIFMNLTIQAFRYAAEPFFFSSSDNKNSPELFAKVMHWFVIVCSFILIAVSINLDIIGLIFIRGAEYREGLHIVPILLLAYLFLGVYFNLSIWFKLSDQTHYATRITVVGAILTIGLNLILIPVLGYTGSALATFGCYFSMAVICYFIGQRYYYIPYKTFKDLSYICGTALLTYAVMQVKLDNQILATSFHLMIVLVYMGIVVFLERKELSFFSKLRKVK